MEDFNQVILDAIYDEKVGHQQVVEISLGATVRSLALTTSYLQAVHNGEVERIGVIVVLSDITEVKELRETELRLAEALKAQHAELQSAYRKIEENNQTLTQALKKVQVVQMVATLSIIGLFVAAGGYSWNTDLLPASPESGVAVPNGAPAADIPTVTIRPQPINATITVSGQLAPRREVNVTSPIAGKVAAVHFQSGEQVTKGQRLLAVSTVEVERNYRAAQVTYIKALERFNELENWENNLEVARLRRSIGKATLDLQTQKNKLDETAFLLERGVIPASEHEAAQRQHRNQQLDLESIQQDLQATLAKGGADARRVARLELDNARTQMQELEETLHKAVLNAPISGVILQPHPSEGEKGKEGILTTGRPVTQGELLLTIGDLTGISVVGHVDEVDIVKIHEGQPVRVSGDAFPDLVLRGKIVHVSSQAGPTQARSALPSFTITVAIDTISPEQRDRLRLGMSANLEVVVYARPAALLVPIDAVQMDEGGKPWVSVKDAQTSEVRQVQVVTGITTVDAVEVLEGIKAGDEVVPFGL